jgi:hypothetical protein
MTGDRRVRFLGEGAVATLPPYPEMRSGSLIYCGTGCSKPASSRTDHNANYAS